MFKYTGNVPKLLILISIEVNVLYQKKDEKFI